MERLDEGLPSVPRRPVVVQPTREQAQARVTNTRAGASLADRLLVLSALLLVVSAAGLASAGRFEAVFLGLFGTGVVLTLLARWMLARDARARR